MGEDVGRYGGAYAVSKGLLEEFGPERIRDTPLSESTLRGRGDRRCARRHAAHRRGHDGELQPARARSDREQRCHAAPHVGRSAERPARACAWPPAADASSPRSTRTAWRVGTPMFPGIKVAGAGYASGRPRHAAGGPRRSGSSLRVRASAPVRAAKARSTERRARRKLAVPSCGARAADVSLITYGGSVPKALAAAEELARERASAPRSSTCGALRPARRRSAGLRA